MTASLQQALQLTDADLVTLNQEERNASAVLYFLLMDPRYRHRLFAGLFPEAWKPFDVTQVQVFYAYALPQDLWQAHAQRQPDPEARNRERLQAIFDLLALPSLQLPAFAADSPEDVLNGRLQFGGYTGIAAFNAYFGIGSPSEEEVQYPGRWSLLGSRQRGFLYRFPEGAWQELTPAQRAAHPFFQLCCFKWAFGVRPELLLQVTPERAMVLEARRPAEEATYPASNEELHTIAQRLLADRNRTDEVPRQRRLAAQRFMLERLLGMEAAFYYLTAQPEAVPEGAYNVTWQALFREQSLNALPRPLQPWVAKYQQLGAQRQPVTP
jgi:hypothetical protein